MPLTRSGRPSFPVTPIPPLAALDRVLVFAPHPDDEAVGVGGLLALAAERGCATRVVFMTSGENNPWAQRASERRLVVLPRDRARFGLRRQQEALASLQRLGHEEHTAAFLGYPDQGLTDVLLHRYGPAAEAVTEAVSSFRPTVVVGPSDLDLHPDHNALAALLFLTLGGGAGGPRHLAYLVHNPAVRRRSDLHDELVLADAHAAAKARSIRCHASQLVLRSPLLLSFATDTEAYLPFPTPPGAPEHAVVDIVRSADGGVRFELRPRWRVRALGAASLLVAAGHDVRLRVALRGRSPAVVDLRTGAVRGRASLQTRDGLRLLTIAGGVVPPHLPMAAKVQRSIGFFDESGWLLSRPLGD